MYLIRDVFWLGDSQNLLVLGSDSKTHLKSDFGATMMCNVLLTDRDLYAVDHDHVFLPVVGVRVLARAGTHRSPSHTTEALVSSSNYGIKKPRMPTAALPPAYAC